MTWSQFLASPAPRSPAPGPSTARFRSLPRLLFHTLFSFHKCLAGETGVFSHRGAVGSEFPDKPCQLWLLSPSADEEVCTRDSWKARSRYTLRLKKCLSNASYVQGLDLGNVVKKFEFRQESRSARHLRCDSSLPSSYKALCGTRQGASQGSPERQNQQDIHRYPEEEI